MFGQVQYLLKTKYSNMLFKIVFKENKALVFYLTINFRNLVQEKDLNTSFILSHVFLDIIILILLSLSF